MPKSRSRKCSKAKVRRLKAHNKMLRSHSEKKFKEDMQTKVQEYLAQEELKAKTKREVAQQVAKESVADQLVNTENSTSEDLSAALYQSSASVQAAEE